jgi:hypothetical protein
MIGQFSKSMDHLVDAARINDWHEQIHSSNDGEN